MNQNIVNQLNIDLPPPVPGKRSVDQMEEEEEEKERKVRRLVNETRECGADLERVERVVRRAMLDLLQSSGSTACLGRTLCHGEERWGDPR